MMKVMELASPFSTAAVQGSATASELEIKESSTSPKLAGLILRKDAMWIYFCKNPTPFPAGIKWKPGRMGLAQYVYWDWE